MLLPVADSGTQGLLVDVQCRISAMALIHEILYGSENLAQVDFLGYLEALSSSLASTYAGPDSMPRVFCSGDRIGLPIDQAVPLGLIANELITNALKHAFPPEWRAARSVSVGLRSFGEGGVLLEIADSGVGMKRDEREERKAGDGSEGRSLGLKLVDVLGKQLGATMSFGPGEDGRGLRWSITIG